MIRTACAMLLMIMLLAPCGAREWDWTKIYPDRCYWLDGGQNSLLEARADGTLVLRPAAARVGQFWIFTPAGDDCYVVTNKLLGRNRVLDVVNGKPVMIAQSGHKLRVFRNGDRFCFKRPEPNDLAGEPPDSCVPYALHRMQAVDAPIPSQSNYYSNEGRVFGKVSRGYSAGSLWRVVVPSLAGRQSPDPKSKIVRTFPRGTILQADVGRGGSDEVLSNPSDDDGNAWMRVRTKNGKDLDCYVRASSQTIQPVKK